MSEEVFKALQMYSNNDFDQAELSHPTPKFFYKLAKMVCNATHLPFDNAIGCYNSLEIVDLKIVIQVHSLLRKFLGEDEDFMVGHILIPNKKTALRIASQILRFLVTHKDKIKIKANIVSDMYNKERKYIEMKDQIDAIMTENDRMCIELGNLKAEESAALPAIKEKERGIDIAKTLLEAKKKLLKIQIFNESTKKLEILQTESELLDERLQCIDGQFRQVELQLKQIEKLAAANLKSKLNEKKQLLAEKESLLAKKKSNIANLYALEQRISDVRNSEQHLVNARKDTELVKTQQISILHANLKKLSKTQNKLEKKAEEANIVYQELEKKANEKYKEICRTMAAMEQDFAKFDDEAEEVMERAQNLHHDYIQDIKALNISSKH